MLRSVRDLVHYGIEATDGQIGHVEDVLFDDQSKAIRYLVINTGGWLIRNSVLISPVAVTGFRWDRRAIQVALTRKQVEDSPDLESHPPVSRQKEAEYFDYYRWPYYWNGIGLWGTSLALDEPTTLPSSVSPGTLPGASPRNPSRPAGHSHGPDSHLKSAMEVRGYHIAATDREFGHVEDFLFDDSDWIIRYFAIDTKNWWPSPWTLISTDWIEEVKWSTKQIRVDLPREKIRRSPEYDRSSPVTRSYEARLHEFYDREPYWESGTHITKGIMASGVK